MKKLPLRTINRQIDGKIHSGADDFVISSVTTVPSLKRRSLLFDIYHDHNSENYDFPKRELCAVVTQKPYDFRNIGENVTVIQVIDVKEAYGKFVEYYRKLFQIPVIGVTGTCGKTTTKEMIKHILSAELKVLSTYKSYNATFRHLNYLLDMDDDTQAAVFEMGVAASEDLTIAGSFFKPQIGIITNIGIDHLQAFYSLDDYIRAKAEMIIALDYHGTLILNADDKNIKKISLDKFKGRAVYFGTDEHADYRVSSINSGQDGISFRLKNNDKYYKLSVPIYGEFNAYNAAAAIAACDAVGTSIEKAQDRLKSFENVERHLQFKKGIHDSIIIDDTWSTNPTSAEAALRLLKNVSQSKKSVAVLGKMSLLGTESDRYHYEIGKKAAKIGIDKLLILGDEAKEIATGALNNGLSPHQVIFCENSDDAFIELDRILGYNTVALIKTTMLTSYSGLIERLVTT